MRLIDADALIEKCNEDMEAVKDLPQRQDGILDAIMNINECPTIEERKKGKWIVFDIDEEKYDEIKCTFCKHTFIVDSHHWTDIGFTKDDLNYCPHCGADMRGEGNGNE